MPRPFLLVGLKYRKIIEFSIKRKVRIVILYITVAVMKWLWAMLIG